MKSIKYIYITAAMWLIGCTNAKVPTDAEVSDQYPPIFPDYIGVTIPPTIAPMNFAVDGAECVDITIKGSDGQEISIQGKDHCEIPEKEWAKLIAENTGDSICFTVSAKADGKWTSYRPFAMMVSTDSIDYWLTYRLIAPGYEVYSKMGIYERCLSNFDERAIIENTQVDGCINCHAYNQCSPQQLNLHVRGPHGSTLIRKDGKAEVYNTKTDRTISSCVYPYWHPTGRYIAYSVNDTHQLVHMAENKKVEVFDLASDVLVYDTETNQIIAPTILQRDTVWETFPAFSPAGDALYFCAARAVEMPDSIKAVRYDLCRIAFDPSTGTFGTKVDTIVNASAMGKSVSFPRPSFDGKHLMYTLSDYGNFSIWHHEADLWLMNLATGQSKAMDAANSDDTESYHNWSSNSRWAVIASRRDGGECTHAYICHVSADGEVSKPFLLPQKSPREYYDAQYRSYNIPELVKEPVALDRIEAEALLMAPERKQMGLRE